jgi:hypothetical protein
MSMLEKLFDLYCQYDEKFDVPSEHPGYNDDFRITLFPDGSGWLGSARRSLTPAVRVENIIILEWGSLEEGIEQLELLLKEDK